MGVGRRTEGGREKRFYRLLNCFPLVLSLVAHGDFGLLSRSLPSLSTESLAPSLPVVDLNEDVELDGDWVLSGQTKLPSPRIRINETALPVNGDYTEYHGTGMYTNYTIWLY